MLLLTLLVLLFVLWIVGFILKTVLGLSFAILGLLLKIIIPIVLVILFARSFVSGVTRIQVVMTDLSYFILWVGIACAYFARYDAHKEVGLLDKEDIAD